MSYTDRQLAAIMFTDIVGYTSLMGSDESKALSVLRSNRSIHKRIIKEYGGMWLKEMGDGTLARFKTISDAVYCAGELIRSCSDEDIELRIGIHFGEITEEEGDIFGEGVNVASRLEPLAKPNQILVSESIHSNIKNKQGIQSTFIDEKQLKNVDEPLRVYKVEVENTPTSTKAKARNNRKPFIIAAGFAIVILIVYSLASYFEIEKPLKTSTLEKSIAVLPFKNLSTNEENQYLADGVMEAILNHLQRIEDLSVRSRTSTEPYRNSPKNITEIGEELEVNYILEGSFQKVGNKANLVVQLISTNNDEHLWAEEYHRDWSTEIFVVQKEVAILIADELYANLTDETRMGIEVIPTDNILAYQLYLKGNKSFWSYWSDRDKNKLDESAEFFRKAIELDGNYSLAYTGLARTYKSLAPRIVSNPEKAEYRKLVRNYIMKAIELDPYNGWAYAEYGNSLANWNRDTTGARINFETAIKLEPNNYNSIERFFHNEFALGNCDKLKRIYKRLLSIKPEISRPFSLFNLKLLQCQSKYSDIAAIADEYGIQDTPSLVKARFYFYSYLYTQNFNKANQILFFIKENSKEKSSPLEYEALLRAKEGNKISALEIIDSLRLRSSEESTPYELFARIYAEFGDEDLMYQNLEKGLSIKQGSVRFAYRRVEFTPYKNEPRFKELIRKSWIRDDSSEE